MILLLSKAVSTSAAYGGASIGMRDDDMERMQEKYQLHVMISCVTFGNSNSVPHRFCVYDGSWFRGNVRECDGIVTMGGGGVRGQCADSVFFIRTGDPTADRRDDRLCWKIKHKVSTFFRSQTDHLSLYFASLDSFKIRSTLNKNKLTTKRTWDLPRSINDKI